MIEAYYNLKKEPFQKEINISDIYHYEEYTELFQRLDYMKQKRGIMLVTGEAGCGKTLGLRCFAGNLNINHYRSFYLPLATVNMLDFYRQIAGALGAEVPWRKSDLFRSIQNAIRDYTQNTKKIPVLIFDECHLMKNENFYELSIISNFEMDSLDPAVIILAGQPHVKERLLRPIHRSINQRIKLKYHIPPLTKEKTKEYIIHQLRLCGSDAQLFNETALEAIYQNTCGIPRVINTIARLAMHIGAIEKKNIITEEEIYRASKEAK